MTSHRALKALLSASSDPDNPGPEELAKLFERIHRIAVIGLSRDPAKVARRVPSYLAAKGYEVTPVNPHAERILGRKAYATVSEVPPTVEMVVIFRPSAEAGQFVSEAAERSDRPAIWLQEGIRADDEVTAARAQGLLVVQDLCTYTVHRALYSSSASTAGRLKG